MSAVSAGKVYREAPGMQHTEAEIAELVALRLDIHANPETAFDETRTSALVRVSSNAVSGLAWISRRNATSSAISASVCCMPGASLYTFPADTALMRPPC
ncbi:hypothetical protein A6V36_37760 [Paraburkholderia ginsengiterrae]|uniref:Uncharacterized protein n=1 Tax=Paraburkholderia ginsengiterrae TaxID=1462993 RepID=A0ABX2V1R2_9BURK|nr:hypothetical protein A6V36_37760 [Paraburkholderia ginsengiterrae]